jgi:hypothetical protein
MTPRGLSAITASLSAGSITTFAAIDECARVSARCGALSLRLHGHRCGSLVEPADTRTINTKAFHRTPMIRFILRFFGLWILAAAFVFLVYDGTKSIAAGMVLTKPFGETWNDINSNSLLLLQPAIERHAAVWLWDPVMLSILTAPTWLVLGVIGIILILLGRKKKPLIGYAR